MGGQAQREMDLFARRDLSGARIDRPSSLESPLFDASLLFVGRLDPDDWTVAMVRSDRMADVAGASQRDGDFLCRFHLARFTAFDKTGPYPADD